MALAEHGVVSYEEFRERLIARITAWESDSPEGEAYSYYAQWLHALEDVLDERALVASADLDARAAAFAVRLPGHDHDHEHGHDEQNHA